MAFNSAPSGYFPNINMGEVVSGTTGVFSPWSNLENINSSTSGDIRQLAYSFNQGMYDAYSIIPTSGQSSQMSLNRSQSFNSDTVLRRRFTSTFNLAASGLEFLIVFESGV